MAPIWSRQSLYYGLARYLCTEISERDSRNVWRKVMPPLGDTPMSKPTPNTPETASACVYLVGAGPGDAGLITLRGVECLRRADVVLYDYLVNPQILEHAPATAERICLGRHGHGRILSPQEVSERMVREAAGGKNVVRLKGGDPMLFARAAEEIEALVAAQIPFEIVPGVTAALAVGSYAGIPLTHREFASSVALVTAHEGESKQHAEMDYGALARFPGTLVFYMAVTTAEAWSAKLIEGGKPGRTPAAIVRRCSWPDQTTFRTTLANVPGELAARRMRPPVVVIVGEVAGVEPTISWFTERPLFGTSVMVTRPVEQAGSLRQRLVDLGADVLGQPAIRISAPADWKPVDEALARLDQYDWLVFSSSNGVRFLLERLLERGDDLRRLGSLRLAAVGPGTAEALAHYRLRADLVPESFRAESLAESLADDAEGKRFLLARASRGREVLYEQLTAAGAAVDQVVVYRSDDVQKPQSEVAQALRDGRIDFVTVTSSAIARSLVQMFGDDLRRAKLASISPITSDTLRELGHQADVEAQQYTSEGVVDAILAAAGGD